MSGRIENTYPLIAICRHRIGIDGDGVTMLVGGAGCPLSCRWCLNKNELKNAVPEWVTAEELLSRVKQDDLYFRATGGGITFGGGEPLLYTRFLSDTPGRMAHKHRNQSFSPKRKCRTDLQIYRHVYRGL